MGFSDGCRPLLICHTVVYVGGGGGEESTFFAGFYVYDFVTLYEVLNK